jgi:hypothetical protein
LGIEVELYRQFRASSSIKMRKGPGDRGLL